MQALVLSFVLITLKLILANSSGSELFSPFNHNPCSSNEYQSQIWPEGIVPYSISTAVPDFLRIEVQNALQAVENISCARFLPFTVQHDYVHMEYGYKCCSHTGRVGSGGQKLYVSEICINANESLAEIFHRLVNKDHCSEEICGESKTIVNGSAPGLIKSPGATKYPPQASCLWKLWKPTGKEMTLKFLRFDLEPHKDCLYDYLHIFEEDITGRVVNSTRMCGNRLAGYMFNTTANTSVVSVHFRSDVYREYEGFEILYYLVDDEVLCDVNNGDCTQSCLSNEQGVKVGCACLSGYRLDTDQKSCIDINECQDNSNTCHQRCTNTIGSYYCHCKKGYGLSADMKTCQSCGGNLNNLSGLITTYSAVPHQNCQWYISLWRGYYLNITIYNLIIPPSPICNENYFKTNKGNFKSDKKKLCGHYSVIQYILKYTGSQVSFKYFTTNLSNQTSGFTLSYTQVKIHSLSSTELNNVNINGSIIRYNSNWT